MVVVARFDFVVAADPVEGRAGAFGDPQRFFGPTEVETDRKNQPGAGIGDHAIQTGPFGHEARFVPGVGRLFGASWRFAILGGLAQAALWFVVFRYLLEVYLPGGAVFGI